MGKNEQVWSLLIGCAPLTNPLVGPVRVSDKWISVDVEKVPPQDGLHAGSNLDWLDPDPSYIVPDPIKVEGGTGADTMPRLPDVTFLATFDPPLYMTLALFESIQAMGCGSLSTDVQLRTYDSLVFPIPVGTVHEPGELRIISCDKQVLSRPLGEDRWRQRKHRNTLHIYKAEFGKTLTELTFSHPQQIVNMLPYLRQYAFLSTLLEASFKDLAKPSTPPETKLSTSSRTTTTNQDQFSAFMESKAEADSDAEESIKVDVTLTIQPVPRLHIVFPFRSTTATVVLEIRENGQVHVVSQNILDESNAVGPNGRRRQLEDIGKVLETVENIGEFCEFLSSRWA